MRVERNLVRTSPSAPPRRPSQATLRPALAQRQGPLRDRGLGMLVAFAAAMLLMVAAATAVGLVDRWWVLVPVMLIDFAVTFGVLAAITHLLADDDEV